MTAEGQAAELVLWITETHGSRDMLRVPQQSRQGASCGSQQKWQEGLASESICRVKGCGHGRHRSQLCGLSSDGTATIDCRRRKGEDLASHLRGW